MKLSSSIPRWIRKVQRWKWYIKGLSGIGENHPAAGRLFSDELKEMKISPQVNYLPGVFHDSLKKITEPLLRHSFDIFGRDKIDCSIPGPYRGKKERGLYSRDEYRPIDWYCDFSSGYHWETKESPWEALKSYKLPPGVDIKWPWELSRFQYLPLLALAGLVNTDKNAAKNYKAEFQDQITDWISNNPVGVGVNWSCEMDVAIRVVNWVVSFFLSGREIDRRNPWQKRFWKSVHQHGRFLYSLLRYPAGKKGNHYASELAGLYLLAGFCPFLSGAEKWRRLARRGLEGQIREQVREDGVHFEESVAYHLLATEIFLYPLLLSDVNRESFSKEYRKIVLKMLKVIDSVCSSKFTVPPIGDDDDGYFFKPIPLEGPADHVRHLLSFRSLVERQPSFSSLSGLLPRLFLPDSNTDTSFCRLEDKDGIVVFDRAGWAVLRSRPIQAHICVGPAGASGCGHAHEDDLSISLFWDGEPVIVDPGTYCYTPFPEKRNQFRSAPFHNQPQPVRANEEYLTRPVFARILRPEIRWEIDQESPRIEVEARSDTWLARRVVQLNPGESSLRVTDHLVSLEPGRVALCLAPDIELEKDGRGYLVITPSNRLLRFESGDLNFMVKRGVFSSGYGRVCETLWLEAESDRPGLSGWWSIAPSAR